jgi:hypothetical protein
MIRIRDPTQTDFLIKIVYRDLGKSKNCPLFCLSGLTTPF